MTQLEKAIALGQVNNATLRALVRAELLKHRFAPFMRWAWPIQHRDPLDWNWHLDAKAEHYEACKRGEIRRLIVNEPPRCLKSWTTSVALPAWWWLSEPSTQFLAVSADRDVVYRDADALRDLCASEEYQTTFRPDWSFRGGQGRQQDAKGYYRNTAGGHRISKAMGQKAQGINADVIIFDDPLDASDAFNDKAALIGHTVHAKQKLLTRLNNKKTGVIIVIMQRLHELDLSGVFLEDGGWEHLYLPAEFDGRRVVTSIGWEDPRTEKGELLHPERLSRQDLEQAKIDLTTRGYAGQYQQQPAPAGGSMVMRDWIRYWTPGELPQLDYTIGSWDPPRTDSKTPDSDHVVGQVWGAHGRDVYLLDQARAKMTIPEFKAAILEQHRLWPSMIRILIEEKGAGKHVMAMLDREIYSLEGFNPQGQSKEERLAATLPLWEQGRVYLPHPHLCTDESHDYSWVKRLYLPEVLTFPGSRSDDQVDATSQALIWIMARGSGIVDLKVIG